MAQEKITYCRICESLCGLIAEVEDNEVKRLRPDPDHPISKGFACPKGLAIHQVTHDPERITHPMRKKADGGFERVSWKVALKEVGQKLTASRARHGKASSGFYFGNPTAFSYSCMAWAKGMADALETPHVYSASSQDTNSRLVASGLIYGSPLTNPIPDIHHTDFMLIVGANPIVSHGGLIGGTKVRDALEDITARGGRVVVVDPRRSETARLFEHVAIPPDSDAWLLLSLIHVIFEEGLADTSSVAEIVTEVEELQAAAKPFSPEATAQYTALEPATVRQLAKDLARADSAIIYGRVGACTGNFGTLVNVLLDALNAITGNLDSPGGMVFPGSPIDLYTPIIERGLDTYDASRSRIGDLPDVVGTMPAGVLADEIFTPGPGQLRSMIVVGGNPIASIPGSVRLEEAFKELDLLVSLDFSINDTNQHADYILPVTTFLEREDMPLQFFPYQTRSYIQWTEAVIPPVGEARQEWRIIRDICAEMGIVPNSLPDVRKWGWLARQITPRFLFGVMLRMGPYGDRFGRNRGGLSFKELAKTPSGRVLEDRAKTGVMKSRLTTDDGKLHLFPKEIRGEIARLNSHSLKDDEYPFALFGRRELRSVNSWMKNAPKLRAGEMGPTCSMHSDDADMLRLAHGDMAQISSKQGSIAVRVEVNDDIIRGAICLPHGWSKLSRKDLGANSEHFNVNDITLDGAENLEPIAGMSVLNGVKVRVEPMAAETDQTREMEAAR